MKQFIIYGGGSPLRLESYHPEIAEAEACRNYGFDVSNLVTVEQKDELLSGECDTDGSAGAGLFSDSE